MPSGPTTTTTTSTTTSITTPAPTDVNNQYIQNLDIARSNGKWESIPELASKIIKHVPAYSSFAKVAQVEAQLNALLNSRSSQFDILLVPTPSKDKLKVIIANYPELSSPTSSWPELNFIQNVVFAHYSLAEGNYSGVISTLGNVPVPATSTMKYTKVAAYKAKAILAAAFEAIGDINNAILIYKDPLPAPSTPEASSWAEILYYKFASLITSEGDGVSIENRSTLALYALRQYFYFSTRSNKQIGNQQKKLTLYRKFLEYSSSESARDPTNEQLKLDIQHASQAYEALVFGSLNINSTDAVSESSGTEEYLELLMANWRAVCKPSSSPKGLITEPNQAKFSAHVLEILKRAAFTTFHSALVMRYHVEVLSSLGLYTEALAAFDTYVAYQDKHRERIQAGGGDGPHGDSTEGACDVFSKVIAIVVRFSRDRYRAKDLADKLSSWITEETSKKSVPAVNNVNGVRHVQNGSATPNGYANGSASVNGPTTNGPSANGHSNGAAAEVSPEILGKAYSAIAVAYNYYSRATFISEEKYTSILNTAIKNYELSISTWPSLAEVYYDYALLLAETGNPTKALETVRSGLLHNNKHFPSWHLLALLLTSKENYDAAIKILNSAISLALEKSTLLSSTVEVKRCILQMKLTQMAIIETITNVENTLEYLPEVLALYGVLFPESEKETNLVPTSATTGGVAELTTSVPGKGLSLTRTKSRLSLKKPSKKPVAATASKNTSNSKPKAMSVENETLTKPSDVNQQRLFQEVWLYIAGVYRRAGLTTDAEESIVEAEHMYRESADTHVELGHLMAKERPLHALHEFEDALDENGDHLGASLGLAQLILDRSTSNDKSSSSAFSFFISQKDELAARARLQGHLETQVAKSPGRHNSKVWWYLACFYEQAGQEKNARGALWKCVALEEARAVRDYGISQY